MWSGSQTVACWLEGLLHDLRFALRGLRRDRGFTLAAIAMLALAIGLNVTVFAVMNTMLFRGFPLVQRNDRLVYMQERYPSGVCCISYLDFEDWRSQAHSFEGMAFVGGKRITLSDGDGRPLDTFTTTVSTNAFGLLGVAPLLGRDFVPADEVPGSPQVVILNYRFWVGRYGKRADIVGLPVHINGAPATVIGVMPEGFDFPEQNEMWAPLAHTSEFDQRASSGGYMAVGRLRYGANWKGARAELETINRRLEAAYPATNHGVVPTVGTYSQVFVGPDAPTVYGSLWAAGWFVLLIACANLANLTLARTIGRWREFSTRLALGAGQGRMVRQILLESLLLASMAGALGWWIAKWSVRTWAVETASRYQVLDYRMDSGTLAYLVAISVAAAILFSLAPIGRVWQISSDGALRADARVTQGLRGKRLAAMLVAGQMGLALVLLSGAGVLVRSLLNVVDARTGVSDPENVLVGSINLPSDQYPTAAKRFEYFDRLEAQFRTIPGIEGVSVSSSIPVGSGNLQTFEIEGRPGRPDGGDSVQFLTVGPEYFRVVGASAISGRDFNSGDRMEALPVAIVNQSFAARFWPAEQPLGQRLRAFDRNKPGEWRTVVGVVPNMMQGDPTRQHFKPLIYLPFRQEPAAFAFYFLRTRVPPEQVAPAVQAEVRKMDPNVGLEDFTTLKATFGFQRDRMDLEHAEMGKHAAVAPIFALMALLLAAVGLYAVIAHSVGQRTKEIGVRMAIGAAAADIRGMVLRDGLQPVAIGMMLGLAGSLGVNRIFESQLVGVPPYDPVTLAGAPAVLILVALLACQIPARRAMHVDPAVALRHD